MSARDPGSPVVRGAVVAVAIFGVLAAPASGGRPGPDGWEPSTQKVKPFSLRDLEGRTLQSKDLGGKVVVVDFWATWCGPCIKELPDLAAYHERLKGRTDVVFLSFNATDQRKTVEAFVKEKKLPYPVYLADDLLGTYEVFTFPTKLLIDVRGEGRPVVRYRRSGFTPLSALEAKAAEVLGSR